MATWNGEDDSSSNDGDIFQSLQEREIEKYFKHKLKNFLATDQPKNQQPQQFEQKFDIEKELLLFLNDYESYKRTQDSKSVTSDDLSDESESDDDDDDEGGSSCEEADEDNASVFVEGSVSGLSTKELDLIGMLTDSKQKNQRSNDRENVKKANKKVERPNVEKQMSPLDLDDYELERQLTQKSVETKDDFLLQFQADVDKLEKERDKGTREKKVKECYVCGGEIKTIGNYEQSLKAHQKEPFHILKYKEKKSSGKSECSSVVGDAALPEFIFVNGNNHFCCKICKGRPIGQYRDRLLTHLQSDEHRSNLETRFDEPKDRKDPKDEFKGRKVIWDPKGEPKDRKDPKDEFKGRKVIWDPQGEPKGRKDPKDEFKGRKDSQDDSKGKQNEEAPKKDKLAYAIGFACIKPVNENQLTCTMCDKYIPAARDMPTLMRNLSNHIESHSHISKMEALQESLKTIKEKPSVLEAKSKLRDNVYKFSCLPCNFLDGYGYQFCKSHMKNADHTNRIKILLDAKVPVNFTHGVKCVGCNKHIYGAKINIDEHCVKCIKENGNNAVRKGPRRIRSRPRRPNDGTPHSGGRYKGNNPNNNRSNNNSSTSNNGRRNPKPPHQGGGNRGRRPQNNRKDSNFVQVDHEMCVPDLRSAPNIFAQGDEFIIRQAHELNQKFNKKSKSKEACVIS